MVIDVPVWLVVVSVVLHFVSGGVFIAMTLRSSDVRRLVLSLEKSEAKLNYLCRRVESLTNSDVPDAHDGAKKQTQRLPKDHVREGRFCPSCFVAFHVDGNGNPVTPLVPLTLGECPDCRRVREHQGELFVRYQSLGPEDSRPRCPSTCPHLATMQSPSTLSCPRPHKQVDIDQRPGPGDPRPRSKTACTSSEGPVQSCPRNQRPPRSLPNQCSCPNCARGVEADDEN